MYFQSESSSAPPDTYVKVQLMHHTKVSGLLAILRRHLTLKSGPTFDSLSAMRQPISEILCG